MINLAKTLKLYKKKFLTQYFGTNFYESYYYFTIIKNYLFKTYKILKTILLVKIKKMPKHKYFF